MLKIADRGARLACRPVRDLKNDLNNSNNDFSYHADGFA